MQEKLLIAHGFKWETPKSLFSTTATRVLPGVRTAWVEVLKGRPGEWALYKVFESSSKAGASMMMMDRDFPGIETAHRGEKLYARWPKNNAKPDDLS